jgi:predicted phage gp36 major capsid-like protein
MDMTTAIETKVAKVDDGMHAVFEAFEAFKDSNDERLEQIEKRMSADVITTEKVDRISRAIDELTLKAKRPLMGGDAKVEEPTEHKRAFDTYVRKGEQQGLSKPRPCLLVLVRMVAISCHRKPKRKFCACSPSHHLCVPCVMFGNHR